MNVTALVSMAGAVLLVAAQARAGELGVGPGQRFPRVENALALAQPGDTILVYPQAGNKPYEKTAVFVTKSRIVFKAAPARQGDRVALSGAGFDYSGRGSVPRAIFQFNKGADGCALDGFELLEAHNDSHNGAGVRINQANDVIVRNCHIHNNDMGTMSNGDGTAKTALNQLIEGCLIHSNGNTAEPGQNHNLYLGGTSVTLAACEVHSSLTGHNVKSRAHQTTVLCCYVHDSANREFDLVDGQGDTDRPESDAVLVGNVIVKAAKCAGNRGVIHFGQDGGKEHDGTIWLAENTIVTPYISPVVALSAAKARACLANNIVWDAGSGQGGQRLVDLGRSPREAVKGSSNWLSAGFAAEVAALSLTKTHVAKAGEGPSFADPAKGDFRLARPDKSIVDAGEPLDRKLAEMLGAKLRQYKAPQSLEDRPSDGKPDLGAYEYAPKKK